VARALRGFAASIFNQFFFDPSRLLARVRTSSRHSIRIDGNRNQAIIPKRAESKIEEVNGTRVRLVDLDGKHLYFFLSGMSMVNAALTTQMAVDHFQLDAIIFAGSPVRWIRALHPGDVVGASLCDHPNGIRLVESRFEQIGGSYVCRILPAKVRALRNDFSE